MVEVGTGGSKSRFIKTNYPNEEGLTLGTTKIHEKKYQLKAVEADLTDEKERVGL